VGQTKPAAGHLAAQPNNAGTGQTGRAAHETSKRNQRYRLGKRMQHYDFILAGGGAAGLSLALHLVDSPLADRSILVLDKDPKEQDDRTWGFWTARPGPYDEIIYRSWNRMQIAGEAADGQDYSNLIDLQNYRYHAIRGVDFYRFAQRKLCAHSNVEFRQGMITGIEDGEKRARVHVEGQTVSGGWVFDSILRREDRQAVAEGFHELKLLFKGWEIETANAVFDPQTIRLLDFRTPQNHDVRFFYVLPYTPSRALVEYTLFTQTPPKRSEYEAALRSYIVDTLGIPDFDIAREESGGLPVTDRPFQRRTGERIMTIGAKGGRLKPTTGYAFSRIQKDSKRIVQSLLKRGHPFDIPGDSQVFRALDTILLEIMQNQGGQIKPVFTALFRNNPIERILRFLDEEASPAEIGALMASLPPGLFLKTLLRSKKLHRMTWRSLGLEVRNNSAKSW
jgi:lycopene beta-cyclase